MTSPLPCVSSDSSSYRACMTPQSLARDRPSAGRTRTAILRSGRVRGTSGEVERPDGGAGGRLGSAGLRAQPRRRSRGRRRGRSKPSRDGRARSQGSGATTGSIRNRRAWSCGTAAAPGGHVEARDRRPGGSGCPTGGARPRGRCSGRTRTRRRSPARSRSRAARPRGRAGRGARTRASPTRARDSPCAGPARASPPARRRGAPSRSALAGVPWSIGHRGDGTTGGRERSTTAPLVHPVVDKCSLVPV